jgi:hypothetical protein
MIRSLLEYLLKYDSLTFGNFTTTTTRVAYPYLFDTDPAFSDENRSESMVFMTKIEKKIYIKDVEVTKDAFSSQKKTSSTS